MYAPSDDKKRVQKLTPETDRNKRQFRNGRHLSNKKLTCLAHRSPKPRETRVNAVCTDWAEIVQTIDSVLACPYLPITVPCEFPHKVHCTRGRGVANVVIEKLLFPTTIPGMFRPPIISIIEHSNAFDYLSRSISFPAAVASETNHCLREHRE